MKNQALQYDNGKYYYIEGGSTRIEVAPESEDTAMDLLFTFREENYELKEGIYPVQVKVNYKYTKKPPYRYAILSEVEDKSNKDNQEKLLVDMMKQDEELGLYEGEKVEKGCNVCGSKMVEIRGKYPKDPPRKICPTCAYERLERIHDITLEDQNTQALI